LWFVMLCGEGQHDSRAAANQSRACCSSVISLCSTIFRPLARSLYWQS
jgi:hypothetical protein